MLARRGQVLTNERRTLRGAVVTALHRSHPTGTTLVGLRVEGKAWGGGEGKKKRSTDGMIGREAQGQAEKGNRSLSQMHLGKRLSVP